MSPGSASPGRGSRPAPLGAASHVLEKDRTELDQAQGALAPGDDGVHARAVDVVGADSAVAIAIEGGRVTAVAAISLTGDEIDEGRFFCLLHYSPQCDGNRPLRRNRDRMTGPGHGGRRTEYTISIRRSQGAIWDRRRKIAVRRSCRAAFPVRGDASASGRRWFRRESPRHEARVAPIAGFRAEADPRLRIRFAVPRPLRATASRTAPGPAPSPG